MDISKFLFMLGRIGRDLAAALKYPMWLYRGKQAPDNHVYKKERIKLLGQRWACETFIETGTFYGQMVGFAKNVFSVTISLEIFPPFHEANAALFSKHSNVHILLGDSGKNLPEAIGLSKGRILYWLDGHYSGEGTGLGDKVSPVIEELRLIALAGRKDDCIVIDDLRLFNGKGGYPTVEETIEELKQINSKYNIKFDQDCIVACPENN